MRWQDEMDLYKKYDRIHNQINEIKRYNRNTMWIMLGVWGVILLLTVTWIYYSITINN